jgi:hypothetical protein
MNSSVISRSTFSCLFSRPIFVVLFLLAPMWASAAIFEVQVLDPRRFSPSELTIQVGDTVRWINAASGNSHDVTADDLSFRSVTAPSFQFEMTLTHPVTSCIAARFTAVLPARVAQRKTAPSRYSPNSISS